MVCVMYNILAIIFKNNFILHYVLYMHALNFSNIISVHIYDIVYLTSKLGIYIVFELK